MKFIIVLFAVVFSVVGSTAIADPIPPRGTYVFKGGLKVFGRRTIDIIDLRMPDGNQRAESLRRAGARCEMAPAAKVRCVTLRPATAVPPESLERLRTKNRGLSVRFLEVTGVPTEISRGDSLVEWEVPQNGMWAGGKFQSYRWLELSGGLSKIVLPGAPEALWLNTRDGRSLMKYDSVTVTESQWRFHEDTAEAILIP